ncbi:MAG: 4Fe-4S dicluster domain-containing protein [Chloroflexi bacterium]|nr:4Fe-4S dicluster domain-containing protein [Chloroflexota bacterium]
MRRLILPLTILLLVAVVQGQLSLALLDPRLVLLVITGLALWLFARRIYYLVRYIFLGQPEDRISGLWPRIKGEIFHVGIHGRLLTWPYSGLLHFFIFWAFVVLFTTIIEIFAEGFFPGLEIPLLSNNIYLDLLQDSFAFLGLVGVGMALFNRIFLRPKRFEGSDERDAFTILILIAGVILTLLLTRGLDLVMAGAEFTIWAPFSWLVGQYLAGLSAQDQTLLRAASWWGHVLLILGFLVYLPQSKHLHIMAAAPNVFFRSLRPKGALKTIDLEKAETFGAGKIQDFNWPQLLDLYSCTECGRCQAVCPAYEAGLPLSPKLLIMDLRDHLLEVGPRLLGGGNAEERPMVGSVIADETLWACTTCRACMTECPVLIEHIDEIVDMRRYLVLSEGRMPSTVSNTLRNITSQGNPWGLSAAARGDWAQDLEVPILQEGDEVEVLWWVGCAGSYDARNQKVNRAILGILQNAGVDFAILGPHESCTGDPARRLGEEYLFQNIARANIETLSTVRFKVILTQCPHCFNTLQNEYSDFGGNYKVLHHSQFIAELIAEGRVQLSKELEETLAFHDPCYLGRHNDIYDPPRQSLAAIPGVKMIEMRRCRDKALCCGAGGALMWMEFPADKRINRHRYQDALEANPDGLATACPYCLIQLDEVNKAEGEPMVLQDIAEWVKVAMGEENAESK